MKLTRASYQEELKAALSKPIVFNPSPRPSIGVEVELGVVDPETGALVPRGPEIITRLYDEGAVKPELFQCIVEVITGVCANIEEVRADLRKRLLRVREVANEMGVTFVSTGTHPFGNWEEQPITENERYSRLVERMGQPARQMLIMGTHVHVGIDSGEKAIAVMNAVAYYLPHVLVLTASSPYSDGGKDSKMASWRLKVFEALPTAGLMPHVGNWSEQVRLMRTLINAGAIESIREVWWDARPHPGFGTIEIRIGDAISSPTEVLIVTAFIQTLVVWLSNLYDAGHKLHVTEHWSLKENKWRAARYGLDVDPKTGEDLCRIICDTHGSTIGLREDIMRTVEELMPTAEKLGTARYIQSISAILKRGASYQRQRACFAQHKNARAIAKQLIREFNEDDAGLETGLPNFWTGEVATAGGAAGGNAASGASSAKEAAAASS